MNRVELEGVIAHELSHIKNYDILVSTLAVTMVGLIAIAADVGVRFLWFGMGRSRNNDNDNGGGGVLAILAVARVRPAHPLAADRQGHAGGRQPPSARCWPTSRASSSPATRPA